MWTQLTVPTRLQSVVYLNPTHCHDLPVSDIRQVTTTSFFMICLSSFSTPVSPSVRLVIAVTYSGIGSVTSQKSSIHGTRLDINIPEEFVKSLMYRPTKPYLFLIFILVNPLIIWTEQFCSITHFPRLTFTI